MSRRMGVVTAFVDEVDASRGRVKLEYRGIEDSLLSHWAPIASSMSGGSRGQLFMPEKGDEALVAYADGDFDHPFVVGFLWNGVQTSPEEEASNRVIVTPGGHQLRFEDKDNDTRVILRSAGEHELTLEDAPASPLVRLKSAGDRELLLDDSLGQGKAKLTSTRHSVTLDDTAQKVTIDAGGTVVIAMDAAGQSLTITVGGNTFTIGQGSVDLKALGTVNIEAKGAATVKAAAVTVESDAAVTVRASGAATIQAEGAVTVTASGAATLQASGAVSVTAGALSVSAGTTVFSGTVIATTVIASSIVSASYTPGAGNMI